MIVSVEGADLHLTARGRGPVCLILTAIGTEPYERQTPPALSDRLRLVYLELRGSGRSSGEPSDLDFDRLAADLAAVRDALGVERVVVLGHSILGVLALEAGRRRADVVSHVVTAGTPPRGDMAWVAAEAERFFAAEASAERKRILEENLARLPAGASPGQAMLAETPKRFFDARVDAAPLYAGAVVRPAFFAHLLGALTHEWDVSVEPASLRVPIFLAHGRHDYVVPYRLWDGIPERLPDATFRLFDESGHQPFCEEPEAFATAVAEWLASR